jgi:hypothetical protein
VTDRSPSICAIASGFDWACSATKSTRRPF